MKQYIKKWMPSGLYQSVQRLVNAWRILFAHNPDFFCMICDSNVVGRWTGFGTNFFLTCPGCHSLSRQRLIAMWATQNIEMIKRVTKVLHFAAEPSLVQFFKKLNPHLIYDTADLYKPATLKINIEETGVASDAYSLIIANHVLEHVDDSKAIAEIHRMLEPGGAAVITVPLISSWEKTYENSDVISPMDRDLHFGQYDHRRYYGRDLKNKFQSAGFSVYEFVAFGKDCVQYGLDQGEVLYILTRIPFPAVS